MDCPGIPVAEFRRCFFKGRRVRKEPVCRVGGTKTVQTLGRNNWIHVGGPQALPKVAAILSVVESFRRLRIPVRHYLATILPGLANVTLRCDANAGMMQTGEKFLHF